MKKIIFYTVVFLCVPAGILVTAIIKREPTFEGKTAYIWLEIMPMGEPSSSLEALKKMGKTAVPALQAELKSQEIGYRCKAAWVLGQLGPVARDVVPDLIPLLEDDDMVVRANAIEALSKIDVLREDLIPRLIVRLSDDDLKVNCSAADLLNKIELERKAKNLPWVTNEFDYSMIFLRSPSLRVRLSGVDRLMKLPPEDERVAAVLKSLLDDKDPAMRQQSAVLLYNWNFMETNRIRSMNKVTTPSTMPAKDL